MNWRRWKYLLPWRQQAQEREMQEELEALADIAGRRELGNLTLAAENARDLWSWPWSGFLADVRYALRALRRQPVFFAVAVVSLALGIGANSAIFSFADAILLRPLPVVRPSEVLTITNSTPDNLFEGISCPDYRQLREKSRSFSGLVGYRPAPLAAGATPAAPPQMRLGTMVSDNFFRVLGIVPSLGRTFLPEEGKVSGRDTVAILGYDFWNTQYGADRSVLGRSLRLNGIDFTIIGVAPESFPGVERFYVPAVFVPLSMWGRLTGERVEPLEDRERHELSVKGRLSAGVSRDSAQAELATIGRNLARAYPKTNHNRHLAVRTEIEAALRQAPQRLSWVTMLMMLAGLVLIIACANVANLMLARARARSREIAIRLAIGAGRFRLARQLMTESLAVALLGGLAGLGFGYGGIWFLGTIQIPGDFVLGMQLDRRVLGFSLLAALASCVLFGLGPVQEARRVSLVTALKSGSEALSARRRTIGRNALVVGQIALAMVLLIAAGILLDSFQKMLVVNLGFRTDHLISMELDPSVLRYSPDQTYDFYRKLVDGGRELPAVRSVAVAEALPLSPRQARVTVVPEGYQFPEGRETVTVLGGAFDENYFSTMKIEMVRGRDFSADDRAGSPRVAVVNEEFAKTYWPSQDPIGKRLRLDRWDGPAAEVIGVAKTGRYLFPWEAPTAYVYLPYEQNRRSRMALVAEFEGDPATLAALLRDMVHTLDADQPIYNLRTVASYAKWAVGNWLIFLQAIATMGLLGLTLAMVGLYGLISYSVSRRTAEIGVRMALGATRAEVLKLVLRQGLILAVAGIAIGGVLAALVAPALTAGLVGLGTANIAVHIVVPLALLVVSAAACYLPARRAAMLDPIRALRYE